MGRAGLDTKIHFNICAYLRPLPGALFLGYEVGLMSQGMSVPFSSFP